jgi:hypothetical protein
MWRKVGAFVGGLITWGVIGALGFTILRRAWPDYALAEPDWAFTLPMQLARLAVAVICSIGAGCVIGFVAGKRTLVPWVLGIVMVALFIPSHIKLWDKFPVWYHLFFLVTLVPVLVGSGRLTARAEKENI